MFYFEPRISCISHTKDSVHVIRSHTTTGLPFNCIFFMRAKVLSLSTCVKRLRSSR